MAAHRGITAPRDGVRAALTRSAAPSRSSGLHRVIPTQNGLHAIDNPFGAESVTYVSGRNNLLPIPEMDPSRVGSSGWIRTPFGLRSGGRPATLRLTVAAARICP